MHLVAEVAHFLGTFFRVQGLNRVEYQQPEGNPATVPWGDGSSAGTVQNYSAPGRFRCRCGKGRNYGRFGTKVGAVRAKSSNLQGEQHQASGNKLCKILSQIN